MKNVQRPVAFNGFTITEILVVISIVGILAATSVVGLRASRNRAKVSKAKSEMRLYGMAVKEYKNKHLFSGGWPAAASTAVCGGASGFYSVPSVLITEGFYKSGNCSSYQYYIDAASGEVGMQWPGIDRIMNDRTKLKTSPCAKTAADGINCGDDLLLIINKPNDSGRYDDLRLPALKKNVSFFDSTE